VVHPVESLAQGRVDPVTFEVVRHRLLVTRVGQGGVMRLRMLALLLAGLTVASCAPTSPGAPSAQNSQNAGAAALHAESVPTPELDGFAARHTSGKCDVPITHVASNQGATTQLADPNNSVPGWRQIGPLGLMATALAPYEVSPSTAWPEDPSILLIGEGEILRTSDAGETWEHLLNPLGINIFSLVLVPLRGTHIVFAMVPNAIYRSVDFGSTWLRVLQIDTTRGSLHVAPGFVENGTVVVLDGTGHLYRSTDCGRTWGLLEPAPGFFVISVRVSPSYATDRTLFVSTRPFDLNLFHPDGPAWPVVENDLYPFELGPGVLRSSDGGKSWTPAGAGLQHGGLPYTAVDSLVISPTFAVDRSLYAVAFGPRHTALTARGTTYEGYSAAIFRSGDAGATWEVSRELGSFRSGVTVQLALSPSYAVDGMAFYVYWTPPPTPSSSGCTVWGTKDSGATWALLRSQGTYETCSGPVIGRSQDVVLLLVNTSAGGSRRLFQQRFASDGSSLPTPQAPGNGQSVQAAILNDEWGSSVFASVCCTGGSLASARRSLWVWGP
jgi:hypothetical protein